VRFLVDMCMDVRVADWLRSQRHDATHLRDEGLQRLPDREIFDKAISENRTVVTFDLDFGEIAALCGQRRTSVIVFRLHSTRNAHVIERLATVLRETGGMLERSVIVLVEESRHRVRYLPVGTAGERGAG